jgi:hypothetical protein
MEHLILEETQVTDKGILNLIDTMTRIVSIWDVKCDSLRLSQPVREKLRAACKKNEVLFKER